MPHSNDKSMSKKQVQTIVQNTMRNSAEKKELRRTVSATDVSNGGVVFQLGNVLTGNDNQTRIGNVITALNVQVQGDLDVSGLGADDYNYMRLILAYSSRTDLGANDFPQTMSGRVDKSKNLFTLSDNIYYRSNNDDEKGPKKFFKIFRRLNGKHGYKMTFSGTVSNSNSRGQLYLYCLSDSTVSPHPEVTFRSYVSFTDL